MMFLPASFQGQWRMIMGAIDFYTIELQKVQGFLLQKEVCLPPVYMG